MNKKLKSMAAAATLAVGLSAGANAAQVEEITPPQQDQFYPNIFVDFQTAACTGDQHTLEGAMRIHPSVNDLQTIKVSKSQFMNDIQDNVEAAWKEFSNKVTSGNFTKEALQDPSNMASLQQKFSSALNNMVNSIEKETGITVYPVAGIKGTTPGCNP